MNNTRGKIEVENCANAAIALDDVDLLENSWELFLNEFYQTQRAVDLPNLASRHLHFQLMRKRSTNHLTFSWRYDRWIDVVVTVEAIRYISALIVKHFPLHLLEIWNRLLEIPPVRFDILFSSPLFTFLESITFHFLLFPLILYTLFQFFLYLIIINKLYVIVNKLYIMFMVTNKLRLCFVRRKSERKESVKEKSEEKIKN